MKKAGIFEHMGENNSEILCNVNFKKDEKDKYDIGEKRKFYDLLAVAQTRTFDIVYGNKIIKISLEKETGSRPEYDKFRFVGEECIMELSSSSSEMSTLNIENKKRKCKCKSTFHNTQYEFATPTTKTTNVTEKSKENGNKTEDFGINKELEE